MVAIQQVASLIVFPRILQKGSPADSIVGGKSIGGLVAYLLAETIEATLEGPRATFALDPRHLFPFSIIKLLVANHNISKGKDLPRGGEYFCFLEVPWHRFHARCFEVPCPLADEDRRMGYQSDDFVNKRRSNYMILSDVCFLPDVKHILIDKSHHWDIARRIRAIV